MSIRIQINNASSKSKGKARATVGDELPATAANIPPELFERILYFFTTRDRDPIKIRKPKELTPCALTCKYWARECRRKIFEFITLRSRDDVETLFAFARAGAGSSLSIALCLKNLKVEYTFPGEPWVHLLFLRNQSLLPHTSVSDLIIHTAPSPIGPPSENDTAVALRSIHQLLPRTLPLQLSRSQAFEARDLHVRRFEDVLALTRTIVCKNNFVHCRNVVWDHCEPDMPGTERKWMLPDFRVSDCKDPWLFLRAIVSVRPRPSDKPAKYRPYVDATEYRKLEGIVQVITQSCINRSGKAAQGSEARIFENCGNFQFSSEATFLSKNSATYTIKLECAKFPCCIPDFAFFITPTGTVKSVAVVYRTNHVAWPDKFVSNPNMIDFSWGKVDEQLANLHHDFDAFVFFILTTDDLMRDFAHTLCEVMPRAKDAGKLQFWCPQNVRNGAGWRRLDIETA